MARRTTPSVATLITQRDDVDLIRFEKNLLQIGFFGAHERRGREQASSRRIEQWVNRDGKRIQVSAEFRSSELLGLPSTADRDKYMGFMKLLMEMKLQNGIICNPIRFSGYSLLKVLGQCDSGENYEALNNWGKRMADTTITSEQVIYSTAKKRYMNKTVHVFRSFTRLGSSNLDNTDKTDTFEVELEDWLLENLNESFVVPEDFNVYRKLVRPTAKGIFVYLYLWFFASQGKEVEKDYAELCALLNVRAYDHVSKIKETMGLSLADLVEIGYLRHWDIKPMSSKKGYKLVLSPGPALKEVLLLTQKKQLAFDTTKLVTSPEPDPASVSALVKQGVSRPKATELAQRFNSARILDSIEYVVHQVRNDRRQSIENPPGYLISFIEGDQCVPPTFQTKALKEAAKKRISDLQCEQDRRAEQELADLQRLQEYEIWRTSQADNVIERRFSTEQLTAKLRDISSQVRQTVSSSDRHARMTSAARQAEYMRLLRKDVLKELDLPSYRQWCLANPQPKLF